MDTVSQASLGVIKMGKADRAFHDAVPDKQIVFFWFHRDALCKWVDWLRNRAAIGGVRTSMGLSMMSFNS